MVAVTSDAKHGGPHLGAGDNGVDDRTEVVGSRPTSDNALIALSAINDRSTASSSAAASGNAPR